MLQPKRTKFRRVHKMKMKGNANRGSQLAYGTFGIKAIEGAWITARQIEAARIAAQGGKRRSFSELDDVNTNVDQEQDNAQDAVSIEQLTRRRN